MMKKKNLLNLNVMFRLYCNYINYTKMHSRLLTFKAFDLFFHFEKQNEKTRLLLVLSVLIIIIHDVQFCDPRKTKFSLHIKD